MNCLPYDDVIPTQQWLVRDAYNNMTFADKGSKVKREPLFPFFISSTRALTNLFPGNSKGDPSSCIYTCTENSIFSGGSYTSIRVFFFWLKVLK